MEVEGWRGGGIEGWRGAEGELDGSWREARGKEVAGWMGGGRGLERWKWRD